MATAWKGTISFGLVNIPITLTPIFKTKELEFHMLHKTDQGRIGYQKVCKKCGKILTGEEIIKGFEHEKDEYIPLEKAELEEGKAPNTRNLEISLFVREEEIDSKLYDRPYYIMPAKNSENLYVLLREAIRSSGLVGVGKIQFGSKEHLAALKCDGAAIILNLMHFNEEMEDPKILNLPALNTAVGKKELDLAKQLVGTLKGHFEAKEFENTHQARLQETIQEKISQGRGVSSSSTGTKGGNPKVIDLMERLRQSLEKGKSTLANKATKKTKSGKATKAAITSKAPKADQEPAHSERHYPRKKAG